MKSQETLLKEMNEIVAQYLSFLSLLNDDDSLFISSNKNNESRNEATRFIYRVFTSFMSLKDEEKEVLNKEYFHREKNGWWIKTYKKDAFLNLLYSSVSTFLRRFYGNES